MTDKTIQDLLQFLDDSPTAWHAVDAMKKKLIAVGYQELDETAAWKILPGGSYFVIRQGSALCAFQVPSSKPLQAHIIGSHTDSPSFKLKPQADYIKEEMLMLGVEVYGSPLLSSWFNRDLGIAGRVFYLDQKGDRKEALVRLANYSVVIPQLALHLDRTVNESGPIINKQEHLAVLASLNPQAPKIQDILKKQLHADTILSTDLFLYPLESASLLGFEKEFVSSYRIDNLVSAHAALEALLSHQTPHQDTLRLSIFWDHEEVGSGSPQGADSTLLTQVLERIFLNLNQTREDLLQCINRSFCVSVDLAHAVHPNYIDKHEPRHRPFLGKGIVIKSNAQQRYASNAHSISVIVELCLKNQVPFQHFVSRNDMPCGTTIGPITATLTGIATVDIGAPQLSMHSSRELASTQDHLHMIKLLSAFLK